MIRVVLAVALTAAVVGASLPAVESARSRRTRARLDADAGRLRSAAAGLVDHESATEPDERGARRVVDFRVPAASWTAADVDRVVVAGGSGRPMANRNRPTVSYRVDGRYEHVRLDVPIRTPDGPLVIDDPGSHRLVLTLERGTSDGGGANADEAVVVVRRG